MPLFVWFLLRNRIVYKFIIGESGCVCKLSKLGENLIEKLITHLRQSNRELGRDSNIASYKLGANCLKKGINII